jgi:hypothetical protein
MNAIDILAVSKAFDDKELKAQRDSKDVTVGVHNVDVMVRVHGTLKVFDDTEATPTCSVPLLATLAIALQKAGFQRENILQLVVESAREALRQGEKVSDQMSEDMGRLESGIKQIQKEFAEKLPKVPRRGMIKAQLLVEELALEVTLGAE